MFFGRPSLICICRSTRATYGRTDNLYSKRLVLNNEQQSACRQVTDWLRESELLRRARDLYLVCRAKDASIEPRNIFHTGLSPLHTLIGRAITASIRFMSADLLTSTAF